MKTKTKAKRLLSTRLENLSDKVDRELRKMHKANIYPKYPAKMFKCMEKLYYEVGKAAFVANRIEEEKSWTLDHYLTKVSEAFK
jgi:hypothetical protein